MRRRVYDIRITVNEHRITKVIIDPHFEAKHSGSINDEIILRLVSLLDGLRFQPEDVDAPYQYFATDGMVLDGKKYKMVWLLEDDKLYVGVVNAYRR